MICGQCLKSSLHSHACPFCGARSVVGWLDPLDVAEELGRDVGQAVKPAVQSTPAYQAGQATGGAAAQAYKDLPNLPSSGGGFFQSLGDLATTGKWLMIGGAALAGGLIVFSTYQAWKHDLPGQSLRAMMREQEDRRKLLSRAAEKHL